MKYLTIFVLCAIMGLLSYRMSRRESGWLDWLILAAVIVWASLMGGTRR